MKRNIKYICLIGVLAVSTIVMGVENPARRPSTSTGSNSSFQRSTNPVSSGQRQRFISQPGSNPYGRTGNDIVSGNVGGGRHFRGIVPYGSSYYSGAYSSSRSVDNFIRRSANPIVNDRDPGRSGTYYDPRRTVTTLSRPNGTSGLQPPQLSGQGRNNAYRLTVPTQQLKVQPVRRPVNANDIELEKILERQYQQRQDAMKKAGLEEETEEVQKSFFETALQQDALSEGDKTDPDTTPTEQDPFEMAEEQPDSASEQETAAEDPSKDGGSSWSDRTQKLDPKTIDRAEGRKVLGEHETFAALADEKFDHYMRLAETHLKKGEFYKAADIFELAIVWKSEDGRGHLGRSLALFFAGEYMSSAYFLDRSFRLNPELASKKLDLTELSGNRDAFENSNLELLAAQQKSGSPEISFLLAYVSYQDGKTSRAVRMINLAAETMSDSRSVALLKTIIDPDPENE